MFLTSSIITPIFPDVLDTKETLTTSFVSFHLPFILHLSQSQGKGLQYFQFIFILVAVRSDTCQYLLHYPKHMTGFCSVLNSCASSVARNLFWLSPPTVSPLISFIAKFYLLFHVNFLYSKVVFHQICINLSPANFQYLNFMEC